MKTETTPLSIRRILLTVPHTIRTIYCFIRQLMLLAFEAPAVFLFMWLLEDKRLPADHPWESGEHDGRPIWPRNIVYRSRSKFADTSEQADAAIVSSIGRFLASMVSRSCVEPEIPHGPKRRMPHAVNFLHGAIHHNGVFVVLDDFEDLVSHLTDRAFRRDLLRFGRKHRREITIVFRNRKYDPIDFAFAVGSTRAHLPWFSNGNGPTKRPVLWGNMSPHPAIATINGAWMSDLWTMWRGKFDAMVRPPVDSEEHFSDTYFGRRNHYAWVDRFLAWFQYQDVRSRGFRGQLFFTDRAKIEPKRIGEYRESGGYLEWSACYEVPTPDFVSRRQNQPIDLTRVSVIIPTLNEETEIVGAIQSARHFLMAEEVIVADGGSDDATRRLAREHGARVVETDTGRGIQCAAGARVARGNVLVFLHADARTRPGARAALDESFSEGARIAMFQQHSALARKRHALLDFVTRFDTIFTRFGDQGIAVSREFYRELGGMPEVRLFEDVRFLRMARRRGPIPRMNARIEVSSRAWERTGVVPYIAKCLWMFALYFTGSSTDSLHDRYYGGSQ